MGDLPGLLQAIFGVVAIIAGGAATALFVSVQTLRASIEDRDKRIEGLEGRLTDVEADLAKEQTAHQGTQRDLESVTRVVTGEAHWVALEGRTEQIFAVVTTIAETLDKLAETVRKILAKVGGR